MEVFRNFTFDAAHRLENLPEGHKCARVHGHTYRLTVYAEGPLDPRIGWIVDFAQINGVTKEVIAPLDHHLLNDVPGSKQPTTEHIAMCILAAAVGEHLVPRRDALDREIEVVDHAGHLAARHQGELARAQHRRLGIGELEPALARGHDVEQHAVGHRGHHHAPGRGQVRSGVDHSLEAERVQDLAERIGRGPGVGRRGRRSGRR